MEKLIHLEIVTPSSIVFSEEIISITAPGAEGSFQILAKHAPFISTLNPGIVKIKKANGEVLKYATTGGTLEVHNNKITMLAESLIPSEEISLTEAEAELTEAENLLNSKEPGIDKEAAKHQILSAKAKIKAISN